MEICYSNIIVSDIVLRLLRRVLRPPHPNCHPEDRNRKLIQNVETTPLYYDTQKSEDRHRNDSDSLLMQLFKLL